MSKRRQSSIDERIKRPNIEAAQKWVSNAEMIADVARLHLHRDMKSVDLTYGDGVWWKLWWPKKLIKHDWVLDGVDFRKIPHRTASFDLVAFDPPYIAQGGRDTSRLPYNERYGLLTVPATPKLLQAYNNLGLNEAHRILRPKGIALVKTMNYVSSGRLQRSVKWTSDYAEKIGFEVFDIFYFIGDARMQPPDRSQVHARTNVSMLLVLRKK